MNSVIRYSMHTDHIVNVIWPSELYNANSKCADVDSVAMLHETLTGSSDCRLPVLNTTLWKRVAQ